MRRLMKVTRTAASAVVLRNMRANENLRDSRENGKLCPRLKLRAPLFMGGQIPQYLDFPS